MKSLLASLLSLSALIALPLASSQAFGQDLTREPERWKSGGFDNPVVFDLQPGDLGVTPKEARSITHRVEPVLVLFRGIEYPWKPGDILHLLRVAQKVYRKCSLSIHAPRIVVVDPPADSLSASYNSDSENRLEISGSLIREEDDVRDGIAFSTPSTDRPVVFFISGSDSTELMGYAIAGENHPSFGTAWLFGDMFFDTKDGIRKPKPANRPQWVHDLGAAFGMAHRQIAASVTLAHELGHLLGLDHVKNPKNLMNPETADGLMSELTREQCEAVRKSPFVKPIPVKR